MPYGTDVRALVATFTMTAVSVSANGVSQVSGITANDFTNPVSYVVIAADNSTVTYTVTVYVSLNSAKAITTFSVLGSELPINESAKTISLKVPYGTDVSALVATFTATGARVSVRGVTQVSGVTANDFRSPVPYMVTAEDNSVVTYTVTVDAGVGSWRPTILPYVTPFGAGTKHTAVWTGTRMLVWGGQIKAFLPGTNTGGIYDPATNTWTAATSTSGAPKGRYSHTAIWTGTDMIVWGGLNMVVVNGINRYVPTDTGGIYNPATNTWLATSTIGAATSRYLHTAVWTGTKMLVWGGNDGTDRLNTGGIYDPATDTWKPMSTTDAPSGRDGHTAVWTGSRLIVWGGWDGTNRLNTGGIYDPDTNTWTAMSTTDVQARTSHTAIWTDTKMIVWGGHTNNFSYNNTGAIYDPVAKTWKTISITDAPIGRVFHTAVWTGTQMIIWGGQINDKTTTTNTCGMYSPDMDTWTTMSITGDPREKAQHTAVWTGTEMIVWGGWTFGGQYYGTVDGGIYSPPK
jgi:hypothetical protein